MNPYPQVWEVEKNQHFYKSERHNFMCKISTVTAFEGELFKSAFLLKQKSEIFYVSF